MTVSPSSPSSTHPDTHRLSHMPTRNIYIACFEETSWATYANEPPADQLRLASPATNLMNSLADAVWDLFGSKYFSTGGDELNAKCYAENEQAKSGLAKNRITER
ncbi:Glucosamine-6-phosphate isomerase (Glucosamine-6-phosphate deaminase) (GNPDA) (GlcN6P deaminase) [Marasmius crinis-equi]|uniref:beta-N-acetylhexosaminidase n=1 Tax=Marasmius crinis-equi TaxID=585013 RepID=A0ABR3FCJ7_9AGAR